MATPFTFLLKTSTTAAVPPASALAEREIAYSFASQLLYIKYPDGRVVPIGGPGLLSGLNHNPSLTADSVVDFDTATPYISGNVLANDSDADGEALTVVGVTFNGISKGVSVYFDTAYASVRVNHDGTFTYALSAAAKAMRPGQVAIEAIGYTASDGVGGLATSQVVVTVHGTDNAPVAVADNGVGVVGRAVVGNVLANDVEPEGDPMVVARFNVAGFNSPFAAGATATLPGIGILTIEVNGAYTFMPDPMFNGVVPDTTYTVTDGTNLSVGSLEIFIQEAAVSLVSNPVSIALEGLNHTYNVGPGQTYTECDQVPWNSLELGDVVNIFYRPEPYIAKIGIHSSGSFAYPIKLNGVTDAAGNRPVIDGNGATTPDPAIGGAHLKTFMLPPIIGTEGAGVIIIKRPRNEPTEDYKPKHIQIQNLDVRGASHGSPYTDIAGNQLTYSFSAGIYGRQADWVLVQNCRIYDNELGVFTHVNGPGPMERCEHWTIRSNRFYDNGRVGSYFEHGLYMQGLYMIIEYNFIGQLRAGATGSSYKSRVGNEVVRGNWVEANARAFDFVEMESQEPYDPSLAGAAVYQPNYGTKWVYGNVIINDSDLPNGASYRPIHFGADNAGEQDGPSSPGAPGPSHMKKMYFWNNTFLSNVNGIAVRNFMFQISYPTITIEAWNNIFYITGNVEIDWTQAAGTINFRGTNLVYRSGGALNATQSDTNAANVRLNYLGTMLSANPEFLSAAAASRDLSLRETSPALNVATAAPTGIPDGFDADFPLSFQPALRANGSSARMTIGAGADLGAYELDPTAPPTSGPVSTSSPVISPLTAGLGQDLSGTNGLWLRMAAGTYSYQWQRSIAGVWTNIPGATSNTFTVADSGDHRLRVRATNAITYADAFSNLSVVSTTAIVAPTVRNVASASAIYRNVAGAGGTGFDTLPTTNLLVFVFNGDPAYPVDSTTIMDNAGNSGSFTHAGSLAIPDGTKSRQAEVFYKNNAAGRAGHFVSVSPDHHTQGFPSTYVVEIEGNIIFGAPVLRSTHEAPFTSDQVMLTSDALLVAFAGGKFPVGGVFNWLNGFTKLDGSELTLGSEDRSQGSLATRVATIGGYQAAATTVGNVFPSGDAALILVPIRFA